MMEQPQDSFLTVPVIKLIYQTDIKMSLRPKISSSKDAVDILRAHWDKDTIQLFEEFKMLVLNRANRVLGLINISQGGVSGTVADPKLIWVSALKTHASGIIVSHNHPSSNTTASQADIDLTRKLKEGGKILEIQLLDHIILTAESYLSFADEGML